MAEDTPVSAPIEGDQPERATEKPTDSEQKADVTASEDKPAGKHRPLDIIQLFCASSLDAVSRSGGPISVLP